MVTSHNLDNKLDKIELSLFSATSSHEPRNMPAKIETGNTKFFSNKLTYIGIVKCNYSVRYEFSDMNNRRVEMSAKDFQKIIPVMVRGVIIGKFKYVKYRERVGISYVGI